MDELISIIIPVYNAEQTIKRCVSSIRVQRYENFEAIFVNDGSTDGTGQILKAVCEKDKRFVLIEKKNNGAAAARNTGIDRSKGKYICFVDSDDLIGADYLSKMYEVIKKSDADVVCTGFVKNETKKVDVLSDENEAYSSKEAINQLLQENISNSPWAKLFRKDVVGKVRMENYLAAEDLLFNYNVFKKAKKIVVNNSVLYSYVFKAGSLSRHFSPERMGSLEAVQKIDKEEKSFYSFARVFMEAYFICEAILLAGEEKKYAKEYAEVCGILKRDRKRILNNEHSTTRQKLIASLLRIGPKSTVKMMTMKQRVRNKKK